MLPPVRSPRGDDRGVLQVLRIHFTMDDLARVRLANGPELTWELLLSMHKLRDRDGAFVFDDWRRRIRHRIPGEVTWLLDLAPPRGYSPDFLTPAAGDDLDRAVHEILTTPGGRLRADIASLARERRLAGTTLSIVDGGAPALDHLGRAIRRYHQVGIAPFWPRIGAAVHADLTVRTTTLVNEGVGTLLSVLHPLVRWRPPVLEVPSAQDRDTHLAGRGLLLVPSFFCWEKPITLRDPDLPPVLVYPIEHDLDWAAGDRADRSPRSVAALIGQTRLSVLTVIADGGCTTTQLARRAGVSIASASQHASVLRDAGLITTTRRGNCVIHAATPVAHAFVARQPHEAAGDRSSG